jgi:hypothetical protein
MARTQHLPLYQSVFIYTREVYRLRAGFPKSLKHDLGQEVCSSSIKMLKCVVTANGAVKKAVFLNRLVLEIEVQWVLLRLLFELKALSPGQFKLLSERLADITKQSAAWLKWVQKTKKEIGKGLENTAEDL